MNLRRIYRESHLDLVAFAIWDGCTITIETNKEKTLENTTSLKVIENRINRSRKAYIVISRDGWEIGEAYIDIDIKPPALTIKNHSSGHWMKKWRHNYLCRQVAR